MSNDALVTIIIMLIAAHYASLIYRLNKAENELAEIRKDFSAAAISAAVAAANAVSAAAAALKK